MISLNDIGFYKDSSNYQSNTCSSILSNTTHSITSLFSKKKKKKKLFRVLLSFYFSSAKGCLSLSLHSHKISSSHRPLTTSKCTLGYPPFDCYIPWRPVAYIQTEMENTMIDIDSLLFTIEMKHGILDKPINTKMRFANCKYDVKSNKTQQKIIVFEHFFFNYIVVGNEVIPGPWPCRSTMFCQSLYLL